LSLRRSEAEYLAERIRFGCVSGLVVASKCLTVGFQHPILFKAFANGLKTSLPKTPSFGDAVTKLDADRSAFEGKLVASAHEDKKESSIGRNLEIEIKGAVNQ
jgi:hypothetical protein